MGSMRSRRWLAAGIAAALGFAPLLRAQRMRDFDVPANLPNGSTVVIGFLGGYEKWDDDHRGIRKVALQLRSMNLPNVFVETIENRHWGLAMKLLNRAGANGDGRVKVILYGQSWGGSAVIKTAQELHKKETPVALTVQVDSVGLHDAVIPDNVRAAANLYQHDIIGIEGRTKIRAANPRATKILENTRLSYLFRPLSTVDEADMSWARRVFGGSHAKMEADAIVWEHVEMLILNGIGGTL